MTTTDDRAARLARLQARRLAETVTEVVDSPVAPEPREAATAPVRGRRRSPAMSAKVLTVGVSTTAMLGMIAGYGIAEGRSQQTPQLEPVTGATGDPDTAVATPAPIPTTLATTTIPPQVIVVVIDSQTGLPIDTDALAQAAIDGELEAGTAPGSSAASVVPLDTGTDTPAPATDPASAAAPTPAPTPVAVDVPTPAPAPVPAPASSPPPEASSGGS